MKFEQLKIGDSAESFHTITDDKIRKFANVSEDYNPIHLDEAEAKNSIFKKRIAHGLFVASFISGVIGNKLPGNGSIYLSQNLNFLAPVYLEDTITARVEIVKLRAEKRIVFLKTQCINQNGKVVIDGDAIVKTLN